MAAFLVMLREGVEAAIIVAILLGYLNRIGRRSEARWVWAGVIAAVLASAAIGILLWNTVGALEGAAEQFVEGTIAFVAAALLTWMIFWMGRQGRGMHDRLSGRVDTALAAGGATALGIVAFVSVVREGVEAALFLISATAGTSAAPADLLLGLVGLAAAVTVGVLVYAGSSWINLRSFFRLTGVLIVLFAAGLVAGGVHEFQELGVLPTMVDPVWNTGVLDPATSTGGRFLAGMFGWSPEPSLLMAAAWLLYAVPVLLLFLRSTASRDRKRTPDRVSIA